MYERMEEHVLGGGTTAKAEILWLHGVIVPLDHLHPKNDSEFWTDDGFLWRKREVVF